MKTRILFIIAWLCAVGVFAATPANGNIPYTWDGVGGSASSLSVLVYSNGVPVSGFYGGSLTNLTYRYTTNAIASSTLNFNSAYYTNIVSDAGISSLGNISTSTYESLVLFVSNTTGSDHSLTMPAGVVGPPGSGAPSVLWCSNNVLTKIIIDHYAFQFTNCTAEYHHP